MKTINTITDIDKLNTALKNHDCVVVMVKAEWCSHCLSLKPTYIQAFKKTQCNNIMCFFMDSEESKQAIEKLPIEINGFPTILRWKNGIFDKVYDGDKSEIGLALFMCGKN